ncbi:DUF2614 family zinc ribbon-containing protein [Alicyclobacillus shizuokensis]|uniref:DUF2614 family zinc ribbon-containing protein n=1 Tax=Alicyclobacillus shizuokensis TaxID=392014 RepID=UPI00082DC19D|nr:DUF2614 family zinc ribbon-containing protein [Alicyclobacillus shizuokensis]MCL6627149.1 hypothetical protein [Alicyclobacillus shizuokensis]
MNVNRWRNLALVFLFAGFFVMYLGVYSKRLLPYLTIAGGIGVLAGILLYFRFGPVNPSIRTIQCPRCGRDTRPTGQYDACAHCGLPLQRTPAGTYEPYVK